MKISYDSNLSRGCLIASFYIQYWLHGQGRWNGVSLSKIVVQSLSHVQLFATPMDFTTPGSSVFHCLLEFAQIHVH